MAYRDYDQARQQFALARRGLPNGVEATFLEALMDRRQGHFEKAIEEFNEAISRDPRNAVLLQNLGGALHGTRQFQAEAQILDRMIELQPNQPLLKILKAAVPDFLKTGGMIPHSGQRSQRFRHRRLMMLLFYPYASASI